MIETSQARFRPHSNVRDMSAPQRFAHAMRRHRLRPNQANLGWIVRARLPCSASSDHADAVPRASAESDDDADSSTAVKERPAEAQVKPPPMFKVILLNDDYTPQEFVVHVLMRFFYMDYDKAERLMLLVHTTGSAVIGIFPRDIAETKSEQVNQYAQEHNYPLKSAVEETDAD